MKIWLLITILFPFFLICQADDSEKNSVIISAGLDYNKVKENLLKRGLTEQTDIWAISYPETQKAYTYFFGEKIALILFVDRNTGKIVAISKYETSNHGKSASTWTEIESFNIDEELPNR